MQPFNIAVSLNVVNRTKGVPDSAEPAEEASRKIYVGAGTFYRAAHPKNELFQSLSFGFSRAQ
jgi:hypothetical protein